MFIGALFLVHLSQDYRSNCDRRTELPEKLLHATPQLPREAWACSQIVAKPVPLRFLAGMQVGVEGVHKR